MPEPLTDRDILQRLAQTLPQELLKQLFPGTEPGSVRNLLHRLADEQPAEPARNSVTEEPPVLPGDANSCMLYTDGASRGNPGEAGAGVVLLDLSGEEIAVRSLYLGQCTNNSAEYQALIAGLELAGEIGCRDLKIFLDSELIVRQIKGQYRVKNAQLLPLFNKVVNLLQQFDSWQVGHVPRSENARADQLANRGIDERN